MGSSDLIVVTDQKKTGPLAAFSYRRGVIFHDPLHHRRHSLPARWLAVDGLTALRHLRKENVDRTLGGLVLLQPAPPESMALLHNYFRLVVSSLLPTEELPDALLADHPDERFVGALHDEPGDRLILFRANCERLTVPVAWFRAQPGSSKPDPSRLSVGDWGLSLCLGDFEIASDTILYAFDPAVRKRIKARELGSDKSFGGALRRLRLSRGLTRADFAPDVSERTIARIEDGDVARPQKQKLEAIAKKLGVKPDEIDTY